MGMVGGFLAIQMVFSNVENFMFMPRTFDTCYAHHMCMQFFNTERGLKRNPFLNCAPGTSRTKSGF